MVFLAGEGGGWMKRDSTYMIESLNGALDGGCSDGQIWRGTTGGRRVAGWRMPGWRGARLTATRKKEQPELQGGCLERRRWSFGSG